MIKKYFPIVKTHRYFISKEPDELVKNVWVCFHGYAQNADGFLKSLLPLANEENLLIALEGTHKFYWKDYTSNPSSSWMTRLERENELSDFYVYAENMVMDVCAKLSVNQLAIHVLGFSQGAAMASRFCFNTLLTVKKLFLIGGFLAHDIKVQSNKNTTEIEFIYGVNDKFINEETLQEIKQAISKFPIKTNIHAVPAKHEINEGVLEKIRNCVRI